MNNGCDPNNSLTGIEFLDFLSWCEIQGIDFEGKEEQENQDKQQEEQTDSQILIKKMKGRDIYE
jgi:hypothetical protein